MRRFLYISLGCFCVVMAIIGAIVPGLPATPWAIAASYFFSRSSPRLHRWLHSLPYLGRVIRDWEAHRGVGLSTKILACVLIVGFISATILFAPAPVWAKWCVGACGVLGVSSLLFVIRTIAPTPATVEQLQSLQLPRFPNDSRS